MSNILIAGEDLRFTPAKDPDIFPFDWRGDSSTGRGRRRQGLYRYPMATGWAA